MLWPSLTSRRLEPEWMDDPALDAPRHHQALRGMTRMNRASGSAQFLWATVKSLFEHPQPANEQASGKNQEQSRGLGLGRPLRVLDLACGGGDNVLAMAELARAEGIEAEFHGCDLSPTAIEHAEEAALDRGMPIRFFRLDALREPIPPGFDVLTNTLFLHHLDTEQVRDFLEAATRACPNFVLSDLIRSRAGLIVAGLATRVFSNSPVVHADGPQSVRAAFTPEELANLARDAGVNHFRIQGHFPQRMCLTTGSGY